MQGNYVGMTEAEMDKADKAELAAKVENAKNILCQVRREKLIKSKTCYFPKAGAHFVIETTRDLPPIIEEINKRMCLGLRPST